ncbi:hypothetical protein Tco_0706689 [Tanacetum coccineum]|uniref:Uncharacterized protein n=1 Tax=Tanacetum coccineum TaxID=301880 RepID=A0ABQ4YA84_9ASTR
MSRRRWTTIDRKMSQLMVELIDKQMHERRIIQNLERFVGARELDIDYKLMTLGRISSSLDLQSLVSTEFAVQVKTEFAVQVSTEFAVQVSTEFTVQVKTEFAVQVSTEFAVEVSIEFVVQVKTEFAVQVSTEFAVSSTHQISRTRLVVFLDNLIRSFPLAT